MRCALLVNGAVAMGACSLTTSLDGLTGGERDGGAPDVARSEAGGEEGGGLPDAPG